MGKDVRMVQSGEIQHIETEEDRNEILQDADVVIAMGGDRTFLKAQSLLWNKEVPIIGVNTVKEEFVGALNTMSIDYGSKEQQSSNFLEQLENRSALSF